MPLGSAPRKAGSASVGLVAAARAIRTVAQPDVREPDADRGAGSAGRHRGPRREHATVHGLAGHAEAGEPVAVTLWFATEDVHARGAGAPRTATSRNLEGPVFALTNLPEVVKGALFARYSRTTKSLRRLFLDEFAEDVGATGDG